MSVTNGETFTMKKPLMIRYHKYNIQRKPESFYYSELFLFTSWKSEATLKSEFDSYQESYEANIQFTQKAKEPFQHYEELIDSAILDYQENGPRDTDWDLVPPETDHENLQQQLENSEIDPDFEHLDTDNLNNTQSISVPIPTTSTSCLVTSESFVQFILDDVYRKHIQSLNKNSNSFSKLSSTGA